MIKIDKEKNIGIIFEPRSGSTVLASYLSQSTNMTNLEEIFVASATQKISIHPVNNTVTVSKDNEFIQPYGTDEVKKVLDARFANWKSVEKINLSIVKIYVESYINVYPEFTSILKNENMQFINLERADFFYSFISTNVSDRDNRWHNVDKISARRELEKYSIAPEYLIRWCNNYIKKTDHVRNHFPDIPTIYYEQFQNNIHALRKMFTGIPNILPSIPYTKFLGKQTDYIENIDELTDCFLEFANKNREYFPAYFNEIPGIKLPDVKEKSIC
jgi:hypothetical protein